MYENEFQQIDCDIHNQGSFWSLKSKFPKSGKSLELKCNFLMAWPVLWLVDLSPERWKLPINAMLQEHVFIDYCMRYI